MKITDLKCAVPGPTPGVRITTGDRPDLSVDINAEAARQYLPQADEDFFTD